MFMFNLIFHGRYSKETLMLELDMAMGRGEDGFCLPYLYTLLPYTNVLHYPYSMG